MWAVFARLAKPTASGFKGPVAPRSKNQTWVLWDPFSYRMKEISTDMTEAVPWDLFFPLTRKTAGSSKGEVEVCVLADLNWCAGVAAHLRSLRPRAAERQEHPQILKGRNKLTTKQKNFIFHTSLTFHVTDSYHIRITIPDWSRPARNCYGTSNHSQSFLT